MHRNSYKTWSIENINGFLFCFTFHFIMWCKALVQEIWINGAMSEIKKYPKSCVTNWKFNFKIWHWLKTLQYRGIISQKSIKTHRKFNFTFLLMPEKRLLLQWLIFVLKMTMVWMLHLFHQNAKFYHLNSSPFQN